MRDDDDRVRELEIQLAFQREALATLEAALVDKDRAIRALEDDVRALKEAFSRLSARAASPDEEVVGKYDVDDPVPRAG